MFFELLIWTIFIASTVALVLWILISPPNDKKVRQAPDNEDVYAKQRFIPSKIPKDVDAIVIGAGMGGGTAASILSKFGKKVVVLEHHDKLGGCTHTFSWSRANMSEEGHTTCEFDTGCHYTAVDMSLPTARSGAIMKYVTDGRAQWHDLGDPYDRVVFPHDPNVDDGCPNNDAYDFLCGKERLIGEITKQINPNEPAVPRRIRKFLNFCRYAQQSIIKMFIVRMTARWFEPFISFMTKAYYTYGKLSTTYVLSAFLEHEMDEKDVLNQTPLPDKPSVPLQNTWNRLKGVMVHPLGDYACQPSDSTIVAHSLTACYYINGAAYTNGATQTISNSVAKIVYEHGGECFVNAHVDEIIVKNNQAVGVRVCKSSSWESARSLDEKPEMTEIYAPLIINAAGMHNLYHKLLPQEMKIVEDFKKTNKAIPSYGHNYLFVTIKGDADEVGIPVTNTWYFNGYDTDNCFDKYFENPTEHRPPTVYLGFPCTKDPTWKKRFPGVSNCILISDAKYEWFEKWEDMRTHKRGGDYDQYKEKFAEKLLEVLYDKVPQVKGKVLWYECGTPVSDSNFLQSYRGGSYGTRCNLEFTNPENSRWLMRGDTEIDGLYMAGQDAWTPAVAGAMYGGLLCATKVLGFWKGLGILATIVNNQAKDIQKETKKGYIPSFVKAVDTFFGGCPVGFKYGESEWGGC
ncbi:all-trans-retinol 13,14-reductase-like [Clytia hemisphaerica]|uniref:all-trans-retinol 13,14-reductase-like n=1 Tax=Clytia hemisphaerica TaxID=252671 RepID=UPI0034D56BE7